MKKILYITIPSVSLFVALFLILFFSIPRVHYSYSKQANGYVVTKAYGNAKTYTIKDSIKGRPVVEIGNRAFFKHSRLEEVMLGANVSKIDRLSFSECKRLHSIDLSNVNEIERNAFSYDISLEEISIGAAYVGASSFYHCDSLSNVTLGEGLYSIGSMAFSECSSLKSLKLPTTTSIVYVDAFYNTALEQLMVPDTLRANSYLKELSYVIYY